MRSLHEQIASVRPTVEGTTIGGNSRRFAFGTG
jgi:hypothetical protein